MKAKQIKTLLFSEIKDDCIDPERNFLRNRKLSAETVIKGIIGMDSGSLTNELINIPYGLSVLHIEI